MTVGVQCGECPLRRGYRDHGRRAARRFRKGGTRTGREGDFAVAGIKGHGTGCVRALAASGGEVGASGEETKRDTARAAAA